MFKNFTSRIIKIQASDGFTVEIDPSGIVIDTKIVKNLLGGNITVPASHDLNGNPCEFPKDDHCVWFVESREVAELMDPDRKRIRGMSF